MNKELVVKAVKLEAFIRTLEHSNERRELGKLAEDLRVDLEYEHGREYAQTMGWKCPASKSNFDKGAWLRYWVGVRRFEKNHNAGRPIIPHRSGG